MVVRERLLGEIAKERYSSSYDHMNSYEESLKRDSYESYESYDHMSKAKTAKTDYIANRLVKEYNAPRSRMFFLKCAWNLSENEIWAAVENSRRPGIKNPIGYFLVFCRNALKNIE